MAEDLEKKQNFGQRICGFLSIVPKGATRPNYLMMGLCFLALITNALSYSFPVSFLPEMITKFGYKEEDKGYYVGLVASAYFAGRAIFSYVWGLLSDRFGRKRVLLATVALHGILAVMFGFSQNLIMAFVLRFLTGACDGVGVTGKTILYEISDNTNQAVGMMAFSVAFAVGTVIGPSTGGFLASPADKYPDVFSPDGFFGRFPYVLTSTSCWVAALISCILIRWKMTESLNKLTYANGEVYIEEGEELNIDETRNDLKSRFRPLKRHSVSSLRFMDSNGDILIAPNLDVPFTPRDTDGIQLMDSSIGNLDRVSCLSKSSDNISASNELLNNLMSDETGAKISLSSDSAYGTQLAEQTYGASPSLVQHGTNSCIHIFNMSNNDNASSLDAASVEDVCIDNCEEKHTVPVLDEEHSTGPEIARNKPSLRHCCYRLYMYFRSSGLVLLARNSDARRTVLLTGICAFGFIGFEDVYATWASTDPRFDGLGFNTDQLGAVFAIMFVPLLLLQIYIFPFCAHRFGLIKMYCMFGTLLSAVITSIPMIHMLINRPRTIWTLLIILTMLERMAANICYSSLSLFINNSVAPEYAGRMNGITLSVAAIFRTASPFASGSLFAWSISHGHKISPLFNVNCTFFILGLILWVSIVLVQMLPRHLNSQKK